MRILDHHVHPQIALIAFADFIGAWLSLQVAVLLRGYLGSDWEGNQDFYPYLGLLYSACVVVGAGATGLYGPQQRFTTEAIFVRLVIALVVAAIGLVLLDFVFEFVRSRLLWLLALIVSLVALGTVRAAFQYLLDDQRFQRRVLVYGAGIQAATLLQLRRRSDQRGFKIVAFIRASGDESCFEDPRVIDRPSDGLLDYARQNDIAEIVVATDDRRRDLPIGDLLACKLSGIGVVELVGFLERETGRVKVGLMNPAWVIFSERFSPFRRGELGFRLFDLILSIALFLLTLPAFLIVAFAILIDDGRPVLYTQRRVGLHGMEFTLLKFRSMKKDAEAAGKAVWAEEGDRRVTRAGRVLRKLRLDELPQLINVIRGDMSLVGPRPERPEFVQQLVLKVPYYHERHCVRPGITGCAQLSYPYGASDKDALAKLEYDMFYVKNRSLILNLIILLQTVEVILWQKGSR